MKNPERYLNIVEKIAEIIEPVPCKYCESKDEVVRFGTYEGVQRWWNKKCQC